MNEMIIAASDGWYVLQPGPDSGADADVQRTPIVAWRISDRGAVPVPLGAPADASALAQVGVQSPVGSVWFQASEHLNVRAFVDAYRRSTSTTATASQASATPELETEGELESIPAHLLDPELGEEDRRHAMIELFNVHGEEFVLHAHEWTKALALARDHDWAALGTIRKGIANWEGRYDEPHNQRVHAKDAQRFADALERALSSLPQRRSAKEIAAIPAPAMLALSPVEYFGGVKGKRYIKALIAYARQGGFHIA